MKIKTLLTLTLAGLLFMTSCNIPSQKKQSNEQAESIYVQHLDWSRNAVIYEVNVRQYTQEGTLNAFAEHLPRLKDLGVDIIWFMPIHPISEKNRKGTLGSYYAVADYEKVNPELGTMGDFKAVVNQAHELGMKVILDWVANHTGWDNWWMAEHPEWYTHNEAGEIVSPVEDWSDVADLNYENMDMRKRMIRSLKFWVEEADIDGYRCDVAGMVPVDFWETARKELDAVKPVFMLAEAWEPELVENAFDMDYGWDFHHVMNGLAKGEKTVADVQAYFAKADTMYHADAYLMHFTSNHDENTWNGTVFERMGEAAKAMAVLSFTVPGMPLIYSGQEAGLNHRLEFFEKDEISWDGLKMTPFYKKLTGLKHNNRALLTGTKGGKLDFLSTDQPETVLTYTRSKESDAVVVVINTSTEEITVKIDGIEPGNYIDHMTGEQLTITEKQEFELPAWGYKVLVK